MMLEAHPIAARDNRELTKIHGAVDIKLVVANVKLELNKKKQSFVVPACKYDGEWGDCDPFKMIKIKEERLISGGAECQVRGNP